MLYSYPFKCLKIIPLLKFPHSRFKSLLSPVKLFKDHDHQSKNPFKTNKCPQFTKTYNNIPKSIQV